MNVVMNEFSKKKVLITVILKTNIPYCIIGSSLIIRGITDKIVNSVIA